MRKMATPFCVYLNHTTSTMLLKKHLSVALTLLLCSQFSISQSIAEIKEKLIECKDDSCKIEQHNLLAWEFRNSNFEKAKNHAKTALKLSRISGFQKQEATALNRLGIVYKNQGNLKQALDCYKQALGIEKSIKNDFGIARAYYQISKIYKLYGNDLEALRYARLNLKYMLTAGEAKDIANSRNNLAILLARRGNYKDALSEYDQALNLYRKANSTSGMANVHQDMGNLYEMIEEYSAAESHHRKALKFYQEIQNYQGEADEYNNLGNLYFLMGNYMEAEVVYKASINLKEEIQDSYGLRGSIYNLGLILEGRNAIQEAISAHEKNLKIILEESDTLLLGKTYMALGSNYLRKDRPDLAISYLQKAYIITEENEHLPDLLSICNMLSQAHSKLNEFNIAYDYMRQHDQIDIELDQEYRNLKGLEAQILASENQRSNDLKNHEITKSKLEAAKLRERNKTYLFYTFLFGVLICLLVILLWNRNKRQRQQLIINEKDIKIHRQQFEDRLKENELRYRTSVIEAQELERKRISEELHDHLSGVLSSVKLYFKTVEDLVSVYKVAQEPFDKANELLEKACDEVRIIAHRMASVELEKYGLISELEELFDTIQSSGKLEVVTNFHGMKERLPITMEREIYKTIRELTTNILKHADANKIHIGLIRHNGDLTIMMEDDGVGFDPKNFEMGLGLKQIAQRVKDFKGTLNIDSGLGNGTTISINLSIKKKTE